MKLKDWKILLFLCVASAVLVVNFLLESPFLGVAALILFMGATALALGKLLFEQEGLFFRIFLGTATVLTLLSVIGTALILSGVFTETATLIALVAVAAGSGLLLAIQNRKQQSRSSVPASEKKSVRTEDFKSVLLTLPFWSSVAVAVSLLLSGRTGEGVTSVWLTIPNLFIVAYFVAALSLVVLLFFTKLHFGLKLALVCVFSLLSHSLFLFVWYPGRYGDPWSHLGEIRYLLKAGEPYAYSWMLQNTLVVDLLKFRALQGLVAFFERILYSDLYWVYMLFVPVLWSVFTPILAYKVADSMALKKSRLFPILASFVTVIFTYLIAWGAISVPNSLGFIFFFISAALFLLWVRRGERMLWVVSFLATLASFLAHPQAGAFAFMFLFFGTVVYKISRKRLWVVGFVLMLAVYPFALILHGASVAPSGLFQVSNFLAFQSEISTLLLVFGLVGLVLSLRRKFVDAKIALLFFIFYVVILFEYYFTKYGMSNVPYGTARILAMSDFLLVPLVAAGFLMLVLSLRRQVSQSMSHVRIGSRLNPRVIGLFLVGLFLSVQASAVLYQAYPLNELVPVQPAVYELDAIRFIDSNSPERYVVLCEPGFASLAAGFLGVDYAYAGGDRGVFGIPEWYYPTVQMYVEMTNNPSIGIMQQALDFAKARLSYFVVSVRNPDFSKIVDRALEIFPAYETFGEDQLYVFWYPLPVHQEPGDIVRVVYDDGAGGGQNVSTTFVYMIEAEINSTLTLTGHSSYNVTDFPMHWTFLELTVNNVQARFDGSSDINTFVYVRDLQPTDVLTVKWLFNKNYARVGWKEDSFKRLEKWHRHELYPGTMLPTITSDGNILKMSYSFTPQSYLYYYYSTSVNITTNDYPYLLMRWRSDMPVAVSALYFELGTSYAIVPIGSVSPEWSTISVPLPPNTIIRTIMVGLSNARNQLIQGQATVEVDYIMLVAKT
jgi:hypothetical protein